MILKKIHICWELSTSVCAHQGLISVPGCSEGLKYIAQKK